MSHRCKPWPGIGRHQRRLYHPMTCASILACLLLFPFLGLAQPQAHLQIQGPFKNVAAVTRGCLKCHDEQARNFLRSSHWTWERDRKIGSEQVVFAKATSLERFGIQVASNPACRHCHPDLGTTPPDRDAEAAQHIDCLVCHDSTGTYRRRRPAATPEALLRLARNVGRPTPANCLHCHLQFCGLASGNTFWSLEDDVHLDPRQQAMPCQACHPAPNHRINRTLPATGPKQARGCRRCHGNQPHRLTQLNRHTELIGCQTCHIPTYGRSRPAPIAWNWLRRGNAFPLYQATKTTSPALLTGTGLTLVRHIRPLYRWDNGSDLIYERGTRIRPEAATILVQPAARTLRSRIHPFIQILATQLVDARYRYLISPLLALDRKTGQGIFGSRPWQTIARMGMEAIKLPFSGQYTLGTTVTLLRLDHGVRPASQALDCLDCHGSTTRFNWRQLGYDRNPWKDEQPGTTNPQATSPPANGPTPATGGPKAAPPPPVEESLLPPATM